jgi:hypothetical protein
MNAMVTYSAAAQASYNLLVKKWNSMKPFEGQNDAFWVAANMFNTFLDYWVASRNQPDRNITRMSVDYYHKTVPTDSTQAQLDKLAQKGLDGEVGGMWLDDYGWWANAFLAALENADQLGLSGDDKAVLLQDSKNCWYLMKYGWDANATPLPGGVWNCKKTSWALTGRNDVTNLQYWLMSVRLAAYTGDDKYLDPNTNILKWFEAGFQDKLLFDSNSFLVRERMKGFFHADETEGFYWAGDQGLFIGCCLAEKRSTTPEFKALRDQVANDVVSKMIDDSKVLHDHVVSSSYSGFDNDYACGKGVFMRHAITLAKLTKNADLIKCIMQSADYAYNTASVNPNFERSIQFDWNPQGKLPPGNWDNTTRTAITPFRGMILQASGVNVLTAAASLDPNGVIPGS